MKKILGLVLILLIIVGTWLFVREWNRTLPLAVGTGDIGGKSTGLASGDKRPAGQKVRSNLSRIAENPLRYENQRMKVTGRVRGAAKLASNRNIYTITDGKDRLLVIDDKAPPKEYWPRTVNGVVKVIGPPVGGLRYAYLVDVKKPARIDTPRWQDIKHYFTRSPNK